MGHEAAGHVEADEMAGVRLLVESLGIDVVQAVDLGSVLLNCPNPENRSQTMSLAEFIVSEHGAERAGQMLEAAREVRNAGLEPEQAIGAAFSAGIKGRSEDGRLLRIGDEVPIEVKKK